MLRKNPNGDFPEVSVDAYIDSTAILCGKVFVEENVYVGPYAVIRADEVNQDGQLEAIDIGHGSNIQDGVVIHSKAGARVVVGERVSIAHRSIVHGPCFVDDGAFIGFNAVVFNCKIGKDSVIKHNSVVDGVDLPAGTVVPPGTHVGVGFDISTLPRVDAAALDFTESVVAANHKLVQGYKALKNEF